MKKTSTCLYIATCRSCLFFYFLFAWDRSTHTRWCFSLLFSLSGIWWLLPPFPSFLGRNFSCF
jgi:hypothetical protein